MDALGLDRVLLVGHDWGGCVGYRMVLAAPERFDGYLVMNMAHPWQTARTVGAALLAVADLPAVDGDRRGAAKRHTPYLRRLIFDMGPKSHRVEPAAARIYADRFRDPVVARTARDTYRTFLLREIPSRARKLEGRRATVPIRALFGMGDLGVDPSLASPETANADDYTFEPADAGHFIVDERPDLVRAKLIALATETAH